MAESFDEFSTWKVDSLKQFLSARGLSCDGTKNELVALCFSAARLKIDVIPSHSDILKSNDVEYRRILSSVGIPDPFSISDNWCDEKSGVAHWPPVFITDIISYFMDGGINNKKYLNDYKLGKAYEYFCSEWLQEIYYHDIHHDSPYCLLRARCTPSQRINDEDHSVWVCVSKDEGEIQAAYCTCTAGLGKTCNHIAGLLFRVEAANKLGITSCTSSKCTWNIPSSKMKLDQRPLTSLNIVKSRHNKEKSRPLVTPKKRSFKPVDTEQNNDISSLIAALKLSAPNACIHKGYIAGEDLSRVSGTTSHAISESSNFTDCSNSSTVPIFDISNFYMKNLIMKYRCCKTNFLDSLPEISNEEQWNINLETIGQNKNNHWNELRKGRITASNFYTVFTRVNTLKSNTNSNSNVDRLVSSLCGYLTINENVRSLKFGREMEGKAKAQYITEMSHSHTSFKVEECGIFVSKTYPYLAASPDALVSCSCCGDGVLEIKCSLVQKCQECLHFCKCNVPVYLSTAPNSIFSLKKTHSYYAQVQAQMAFTSRKWCDFYVYTINGSFVERIEFDSAYFCKLLENVMYFFKTYMVPELIDEQLKTVTSVLPQQKESVKGNTFFCPSCKSVIQENENIKSFQDRSICCDKCNKWYHFKCVKLTKAQLLKHQNSDWFCTSCS